MTEPPIWNLDPLVADAGGGERGALALLERAHSLVPELEAYRGRVATLGAGELARVMQALADLHEHLGRAASWASLRFAADASDPAVAALMQRVNEDGARMRAQLLFFDLEWVQVPDERVEELLRDDALAFCRHYLRSSRRWRPFLLSEPEERVDAEKEVSGRAAWVRLFGDLTTEVRVDLTDDAGRTERVPLERGLAELSSGDRERRRRAAEAITAGLAPGLRTRAFVYNTVLLDKAIDDRLRGYPTWITSRNLANEASDASVDALVAAVRARYDVPQRWYRLKAKLLGVPKIADYDRLAPVGGDDTEVAWDDARALVLEAYGSFSHELAGVARRFFDERWIDAPVRPGKRHGAFCASTVPSCHPFVCMNWTGRQRDVLTLAHELGHGLHGWLARPQGIFHQTTPLTVAETASVFCETITFRLLLARARSARERLALLAQSIDGAVATVFRQTAMNQFERMAHEARRTEGELSADRLGELWTATQTEMLGDAVELTAGYRTWWSYVSHFVSTPGYVYAYAYGQLLAMSVVRQWELEGDSFVARYVRMLSAGGSLPPEELGAIVGCDLRDPDFWKGGIALVERQLVEAEETAAGLVS